MHKLTENYQIRCITRLQKLLNKL